MVSPWTSVFQKGVVPTDPVCLVVTALNDTLLEDDLILVYTINGMEVTVII